MSEVTHPKQPVTRSVLEAAAASVGIAVGTMLSGSREPHIVEARRLAARTFRQPPHSWSLPRIGRALGGVHHTTVLNLLNKKPRRPIYGTSPDVIASAEDDIMARIAQIETERGGLRGKLAKLDTSEALLRKALCLLKDESEE